MTFENIQGHGTLCLIDGLVILRPDETDDHQDGTKRHAARRCYGAPERVAVLRHRVVAHEPELPHCHAAKVTSTCKQRCHKSNVANFEKAFNSRIPFFKEIFSLHRVNYNGIRKHPSLLRLTKSAATTSMKCVETTAICLQRTQFSRDISVTSSCSSICQPTAARICSRYFRKLFTEPNGRRHAFCQTPTQKTTYSL